MNLQGITAPYLATDCVGALGRELRIHATNGRIKMMVAIDKANGLYDTNTVVKRPDRSLVSFLLQYINACNLFLKHLRQT